MYRSIKKKFNIDISYRAKARNPPRGRRSPSEEATRTPATEKK
jgi:hypothetical protein